MRAVHRADSHQGGERTNMRPARGPSDCTNWTRWPRRKVPWPCGQRNNDPPDQNNQCVNPCRKCPDQIWRRPIGSGLRRRITRCTVAPGIGEGLKGMVRGAVAIRTLTRRFIARPITKAVSARPPTGTSLGSWTPAAPPGAQQRHYPIHALRQSQLAHASHVLLVDGRPTLHRPHGPGGTTAVAA